MLRECGVDPRAASVSLTGLSQASCPMRTRMPPSMPWSGQRLVRLASDAWLCRRWSWLARPRNGCPQ